MNIGIFTDCYYPQINGVVSSVMILREELLKQGHKVTIITVKIPGYVETSPDIIRIHSIPFTRWNEFRVAIPLFARAYKKIKALNLDVIHTHTEFSIGFFGKYMARALDIPILHTYHTMYEDYSHYVMNFSPGKKVVKKLIIRGSKQYVRKFNAVIAPSMKTKAALERYGVKNDIFVVPTGIDLEQFPKYERSHPRIVEIRSQLGLSEDTPILLSLGRVSEEKNIQFIIHEMTRLKAHLQELKLVIVGDGPYREKLESLVRQQGLQSDIIFAGRVPWEDVAYYYSMSDAFISASKTETQGLTILEAMASGIPVIVYNDDNIRDVIVHGVSGHLFEDADSMVDAIVSTFTNVDFTHHMASNASKIVLSMTKEHYGENALQIYERLVTAYAQENALRLQ